MFLRMINTQFNDFSTFKKIHVYLNPKMAFLPLPKWEELMLMVKEVMKIREFFREMVEWERP